MPTLADVTGFAVDSDCLFTWDAVPNAEGYELRQGVDWETGTKLLGVDVIGTSYQHNAVLDNVTVWIKAKAEGYDESLNAVSVTTDPAPFIADVTGVTVNGSDELVFDLVTDATLYEVRFTHGFTDDVGASLLLTTQADNTPVPVPNNAGYRYYVRAYGPCNTRSDNYTSYFSEFDTDNSCFLRDLPRNLDWFYPFTVDAIDKINGSSAVQLRGSEQVGLNDEFYNIYPIDSPAIGFYGLEHRVQDTTDHWFANDPTQSSGTKGWRNPTGVTTSFDAGTEAPDESLGVGRITEQGGNSLHKIQLSEFNATTAGFQARLHCVVRANGGLTNIRFRSLPTSFSTFDLALGEYVPSESNGVNQNRILDLGNDFYYIYSNTDTVGSGANVIELELLDDSFNDVYVGDTNRSLEVWGFGYSRTNASIYAPILSVIAANATRLQSTETSIPVTTPTDRDYSIYYELTFTAAPPAGGSGNGSALIKYGDLDFIAPSGDGLIWAWNFSDTDGVAAAIVQGGALIGDDVEVSLGATPAVGQTLQVLTEIRDGEPLRITVDTFTNENDIPSFYPAGMVDSCVFDQNIPLGFVETFFSIKNFKRIRFTGMTIEQAAAYEF